MRYEECDTEGSALILTAPFRRSEPEPDWVAAQKSGTVPNSLIALYERAHFLSFGTAPPFLDDRRRRLFTYFGLMLRGIKQSFVDADEELVALELANTKIFDQGKLVRGEEWSPEAPSQAKKHFKLLLISLCAALDCTAELTSLILPGAVPGLKLGRAEFSQIERWVLRGEPVLPTIASPIQLIGSQLYVILRPLLVRTDEAKDWLAMLRLYRNKAVHLGSEHFRELGLYDRNRVSYTFLPTRWPVLWEEHIKLNDSSPQTPPPPIDQMFGGLMRQDKISFARDLRQAVIRVVETMTMVLDSAYRDFHNFPVNSDLVMALDKSFKQYDFRAFTSMMDNQ